MFPFFFIGNNSLCNTNYMTPSLLLFLEIHCSEVCIAWRDWLSVHLIFCFQFPRTYVQS